MSWVVNAAAVAEYQQIFATLNPDRNGFARRNKAIEISANRTQQSFAITKVIWEFVDPVRDVNVDLKKFVAAMIILASKKNDAKELTADAHDALIRQVDAVLSQSNENDVAPSNPPTPSSISSPAPVSSIPTKLSPVQSSGLQKTSSQTKLTTSAPSTPNQQRPMPVPSISASGQANSPAASTSGTPRVGGAPSSSPRPLNSSRSRPMPSTPSSGNITRGQAPPSSSPSLSPSPALGRGRGLPTHSPGASTSTPSQSPRLPPSTTQASQAQAPNEIQKTIAQLQKPKPPGRPQSTAATRASTPSWLPPNQGGTIKPSLLRNPEKEAARKAAEEERKRKADSAKQALEAKKKLLEDKRRAEAERRSREDAERTAKAKQLEEDAKKADELLKAEEERRRAEEEKKKAEVKRKVAEEKKKSEEATRKKIEEEKRKADAERKELENKMKQIAEANKKRTELAAQQQKAVEVQVAKQKADEQKKAQEEIAALKQKVATEEAERRKLEVERTKLENEKKRLEEELKKKTDESAKTTQETQDKLSAELKKKESEVHALKQQIALESAEKNKALEDKKRIEEQLRLKSEEVVNLTNSLNVEKKRADDERDKRMAAEKDRDEQVDIALKKAAQEVELRVKLTAEAAEKERKLKDDLNEANEMLTLMEQEKDEVVASLEAAMKLKLQGWADQHVADKQEIEALKVKVRELEDAFVDAVETGEKKIVELEEECSKLSDKNDALMSDLDALKEENEELKRQLDEVVGGVREENSDDTSQGEDGDESKVDEPVVFVFDKSDDSSILDGLDKLPDHEWMMKETILQHKSELGSSLVCRVIYPGSPEADASNFEELASCFGPARCLLLVLWERDSLTEKLDYLTILEQKVELLGGSKSCIVQWDVKDGANGKEVASPKEAVQDLNFAIYIAAQ